MTFGNALHPFLAVHDVPVHCKACKPIYSDSSNVSQELMGHVAKIEMLKWQHVVHVSRTALPLKITNTSEYI